MLTCVKTGLAGVFLLSSSIAFASPAGKIDNRFIGDFEGQRNLTGKCQFLSWSTTRSKDGRFVISFYSDQAKRRPIGKEAGTWWVEKNKFYMLTNGLSKPESYSFKFKDHDTIELSVVKRDPTADCKEDYRFIDRRK